MADPEIHSSAAPNRALAFARCAKLLAGCVRYNSQRDSSRHTFVINVEQSNINLRGSYLLDINSFDENAITWRELPDVGQVWLSTLDVDETAKIVDVLLRFAANEKIVLHRHVAAFHTFVVKGEHRICTPEGELKEVWPVGTYKAGKADPEPHTEGGGETDLVILFSLRPYCDRAIYEILDEDGNIADTMTFDGMKELYAEAA